MKSTNSYFPLLKKLTIIIPTYKRELFSLRCAQYLAETGATIILLDGNKAALKTDILKKIDKKIRYIHSPTGYYERVLLATNLVSTEFVMMGIDDEFFIPSALNSCLEQLIKKPELIACCGRAMGFYFRDGLVFGKKVYQNLKDRTSNDDNPTNRIKKHFSNYGIAHFYAVCRTDIWKIAAKTTFSKEYSCFAMAEIQMELILCYAGKSLIIPELMWLRSGENKPLRGMSPNLIETNTIWKWWFSKKYKKEKNEFISQMKSVCKKLQPKYSPDIEGGVYCLLESLKKDNSPLFNFFYKIFKYFPKFIQDLIKIIFKYFKLGPLKNTPFMDQAKLLSAEGVNVDFNELRSIEKIIINFYKNNNNKL